MLDLKFIRENPDVVRQAIKNRRMEVELDTLLSKDAQRRALLQELEELNRQKNIANDEISQILAKKGDPKAKIEGMKAISQKIDNLREKVGELEQNLAISVLNIPNIPHNSVPIGDATQNKVVRTWGEVRKFEFKPLTHLELGETLDILDFPRAAKIAGSGFPLYKKQGAHLERALINFMLDLHTTKHGYTEIFPPFLVNRKSMTGTGQLPKLEVDMYRLKDDDLFLVPTAEVPLTNLFADEVLKEEDLPIYYTAYTACFRREAGSYGKETKGLIRVHQFDKVELVKFVRPDTSYDELEKLVVNAEEVLRLLGLAYRVNMLSTGDLGFAASKCYDLECYAPATGAWLEVSSCSNFEDFQARRANIKFRRATRPIHRMGTPGQRATEYIHTLNGSGIALARTFICIMENYQEPDGTIRIPEVLRPYMNGLVRIK